MYFQKNNLSYRDYALDNLSRANAAFGCYLHRFTLWFVVVCGCLWTLRFHDKTTRRKRRCSTSLGTRWKSDVSSLVTEGRVSFWAGNISR
jgi:hypothetical protein